jgi:hypothetical protein
MKRNRNQPLTPIESFCLDSFIINGNVDMAYSISHPNSKATSEYKHTLALRWLKLTAVKAYLTQKQGTVLFVGDKTADFFLFRMKIKPERRLNEGARKKAFNINAWK